MSTQKSVTFPCFSLNIAREKTLISFLVSQINLLPKLSALFITKLKVKSFDISRVSKHQHKELRLNQISMLQGYTNCDFVQNVRHKYSLWLHNLLMADLIKLIFHLYIKYLLIRSTICDILCTHRHNLLFVQYV